MVVSRGIRAHLLKKQLSLCVGLAFVLAQREHRVRMWGLEWGLNGHSPDSEYHQDFLQAKEKFAKAFGDDLSNRKRLEQTEVDEDIWTAMVGPTVGFVLCCLHATHHCKDARVKKGHYFALRVNSRCKDGVNQAAGLNHPIGESCS